MVLLLILFLIINIISKLFVLIDNNFIIYFIDVGQR